MDCLSLLVYHLGLLFQGGAGGLLVEIELCIYGSKNATSASHRSQAKVMQVGPAPMAPSCRTVCARARGSQEYTMGGRLGVVRVDPGAISAAQAWQHRDLKAGAQDRCLALG